LQIKYQTYIVEFDITAVSLYSSAWTFVEI
jgi:hypothetical protein